MGNKVNRKSVPNNKRKKKIRINNNKTPKKITPTPQQQHPQQQRPQQQRPQQQRPQQQRPQQPHPQQQRPQQQRPQQPHPQQQRLQQQHPQQQRPQQQLQQRPHNSSPNNSNKPLNTKKKKKFTKKYSELTPRERAIYLKRKQKQLLKREKKLQKSLQRKEQVTRTNRTVKKRRRKIKDPYAINYNHQNNTGGQNLRRHKKRYKKNYTLYYILLTIITSITLYSLSITVWFEIEEITVVGDIDVDYEEIIEVSGIQLYENLVKLSEKSVSQKVCDAYITIESVELNKKFPNKVEIEVTMAQPKALLYYDRMFYTLSQSDRVISYVTKNYYDYNYRDTELISFIGLDLEGMDLGDYLHDFDDDLLEDIDRLLRVIDDNDFDVITYVDISNILDIRFYVDDLYEIKAGGFTEISYKLHCAKWIIDLQDEEFAQQGIIDVSVDDGKYYLRPSMDIQPNL